MFVTLVELAMVILFILVLVDAARHFKTNRKKMLLLGLAFVYALIFENFNIILSKGSVGGYFYNPEFLLYVWHMPLFVAAAWAALIYTAMHISDVLELKTLTRPFMDAFLVLNIDLTLDVVASRQKLWTWVGFTDLDGWFGIPADNFIGWLFVVFMFSFLFRYFSRSEDAMVNMTTRTEYYILLPAFAYLAMLVLFSIVNFVEEIFHLTRSEELFLLWGMVILFAAMIRTAKEKAHQIFEFDGYTLFIIFFTRLSFFIYIMWSLVLMKPHIGQIALGVILVITMVAELLVYHSAFGHIGGNLKWFEKKKDFQHY
ncbi:MAG: carotenoid biosynthesis protein [Candidatus Woesearchaeota archaeon]